MVVKHRISLIDCDLLVHESEDHSFQVFIQSTNNPLSRGNLLHSFETERQAVEAAERFHWMYVLAKENGYYLKQDCFIKPNRNQIHISIMADCTMTKEHYVLQLQGSHLDDPELNTTT